MNNIDSFITSSKVTVKKAWQQLNTNNCAILFIVDQNQKLIGSFVDGDVRRWILGDNSLNEPVTNAMNKNPITVNQKTPLEEIKKILISNKIHSIPMVNDNNKIVDIKFITDFIQGDSTFQFQRAIYDTPVVIMAGGLGTRLKPYTNILPKPLMPLGDKPIIETIINKFEKYKINSYYISLNHKANLIRAYFKDINKKSDIHFFQENTPLGTAGSLFLLKEKIKSDFFVTNCDILINTDYYNLLSFHKQQNSMITIVCAMQHFVIPYGVIKLNNKGSLQRIIEKPEYSNLVNTGLYVLSEKVFEYIENNEFLDMTTLIERVQNKNNLVSIFPIATNDWIDTGELAGMENAIKRIESFS